MDNLIRIKKYDWECIKKIGQGYHHLERGFFQGQNKEAEVIENLLQEYRLLAYASIDDFKLDNTYSIITKKTSKVSYNFSGKSYEAEETTFSEHYIRVEKITEKFIIANQGFTKIKKEEIYGIIE